MKSLIIQMVGLTKRRTLAILSVVLRGSGYTWNRRVCIQSQLRFVF